LRKAPASSEDTCCWALANSQKGSTVPIVASATNARIGPHSAAPGARPSKSTADGSATSAPAANWTARVMTLLRLEELKPASPLPLEPTR
jgi:hypothetical protein